jgi:very-short-patch-repair endonuclease
MSGDKKDLFLHYWLSLGGEHPIQEYNFDASIGRKHRFDFAWLKARVAVEIDGNAWHTKGGGRHGTDSDREKMNLAVSMGWRVFRFSPQMIERDPERWIDMVKRAIIEKDSAGSSPRRWR